MVAFIVGATAELDKVSFPAVLARTNFVVSGLDPSTNVTGDRLSA